MKIPSWMDFTHESFNNECSLILLGLGFWAFSPNLCVARNQ